MTRRTTISLTLAAAVALGWLLPVDAHAQAPDIRNIRPVVMLLMDTSGSMERMGSCACTTPACTECLPSCAAGDQNRWTEVLQAMTGTFDTFSCTSRNRSIYAGSYDHNYYIPHHEIGPTSQQTDGILDVYRDRVRFGLMTFDGVGTLTSANALVSVPAWDAAFIASSQGATGMYSYGGPKLFNFPGCLTDYQIDNGGRSDSPPGGFGAGFIGGNMVSVGTDTDDHTIINQRIQDSMMNTRPFGPTPVAGMLDDVRYYFANHNDVRSITAAGAPGDPFAACRDRYVVMVTDGYPNADFRDAPYDCDACVDTTGDGTPDTCYTCPYDTPENITADLCQFNAGTGLCEGTVDGVYAVGFNVADPAAITRLNDIAAVGGTTSAFFASGGAASLRTALSAALDSAAPGTTTRTIPAFANTAVTGGSNRQFQFNTGFNLSLDPGEPWAGVLERRRFECNGLVVEEKDIDDADNDRFHVVLQARAAAGTRQLFTAIPTNPVDATGFLTGTGEGDIPPSLVPPALTWTPLQKDLTTVAFDTANITPALLTVPDAPTRNDVVNWIHANSSAPANRQAAPLADIYHSSPAVHASPALDLPDEAFNLFRATAEVSSRPTVVYVGSNDGILHAFAAEDHIFTRADLTTVSVTAGEELWGFIPPGLLPRLKDAMASHQWMVDGTPIVKDMFTVREPGDPPTAAQYRTILVVGLRGGGDYFFALDVTNPVDPPRFLWQFTHPGMGNAYGNPALAQALVRFGGGNLHERSVAILPGGEGQVIASTGCASSPLTKDALGGGAGTHRGLVNCWQTAGRQMYVIDLITGLLLRHFDESTLTAPLDGGISVFTGNVGTIASRGYTTDRDGVIWRLDLSSANPNNWDLAPFHDMFPGGAYDDGQPGFNAPILSTNNKGEVVVIQATGNIDLLDSSNANRVVSLTEQLSFDAAGVVTNVDALLNWDIPLAPGEQVTGPLELFDSRVFFGTFRSDVSPVDACEYGFSQLWGVHYLNRRPGGGTLPDYGLESVPGAGFDTDFVGPFDNQIIMGATITQRPNCFSGVEEVSTDSYLGNRYRVTGQGGGGFQLVAQVGGGGTVATGGSVGEITRDLPPPVSYTQVQAWLSATE